MAQAKVTLLAGKAGQKCYLRLNHARISANPWQLNVLLVDKQNFNLEVFMSNHSKAYTIGFLSISLFCLSFGYNEFSQLGATESELNANIICGEDEKVYVAPEAVQLSAEGIFIFLESDLFAVDGIYSDAEGIYFKSSEKHDTWVCRRCGRVNMIEDRWCLRCGRSWDGGEP